MYKIKCTNVNVGGKKMNKLRKVLDIIEHKHLDAIIVLSDYNRRYLSDFTGTSGALIITPKTISYY